MAFLRGTISGDPRWPRGGCSQRGKQQCGGGDGGSSSAAADGEAASASSSLLDPEVFSPERWLAPGADKAGEM
jgi:hypothetical protein